MSDLGLMLILFVGFLIMIGVLKFFAWLTTLQEEHGSVARAGMHTIQRYITVNRSQVVMSPETPQTNRQTQTDEQTDYVSEADRWLDRLEVDRTKTAIIELLVYSGWDVGQVRGVIKGDNGAIGIEVEAARQRLGIVTEPRQLRVRDDHGERLIPMEM